MPDTAASQLVEAFTIFGKYTDQPYITHCEHDIMYVMVEYEQVSEEDRQRLSELGFDHNDENGESIFSSFQHGSC